MTRPSFVGSIAQLSSQGPDWTVSTHIPAPAAPAEGSEAVHSDEDSCLQQRNKSTEGNIGTCPGIFQTASEGNGILTASGS